MEEQTNTYEDWPAYISAFLVVATIILSVTVELARPETAKFGQYFLLTLASWIIGWLIGRLIELISKVKEKSAQPLRFINYLHNASGYRIESLVNDDLHNKALNCLRASKDSIKFQAEMLSGNGRAACRNEEVLEQIKKSLNDRVKTALEEFYSSYDVVKPFAHYLGGLKKRDFKEFVHPIPSEDRAN